jgi:hypothetical protein
MMRASSTPCTEVAMSPRKKILRSARIVVAVLACVSAAACISGLYERLRDQFDRVE